MTQTRWAWMVALGLGLGLTPACGDGGATTDEVMPDAAPDAAIECTAAAACDDDNPCTIDDCVAQACVHTDADAGTACDDDDACTQSSACSAGACVGADPVVCTAQDQCHGIGVCDPDTGACSQPALDDNSACDDGDACTQSDTCQGGACTGANPVTCTALDQCHIAGVCDPGTGTCSQPNADDNTACDDGDACTQSDTCQAGACAGADPVECIAIDQCHVAGVCDPGTGTCSTPAADDDTACDDGDLCTQSDTCQAGTCAGADPVSCTALDDCHEAGVCDPGTGACSDPALDAVDCAGGAGVCVAGTCDLDPVTLDFTYTGTVQTWTVPAWVHSVSITAWGAQGRSSAQGIPGGLGGMAEGQLAVTPGDVLTIYVGDGGGIDVTGGFGGGGAAGVNPCTGAQGGGGGGASDVRVGLGELADRVLVGGGGGGAAGSRISGCGRGTGGGGGAGYFGGGGGAAWPSTSVVLPTGGSQVAGGLGGTSTYTTLSPGNNGAPGEAGLGGKGGDEVTSTRPAPRPATPAQPAAAAPAATARTPATSPARAAPAARATSAASPTARPPAACAAARAWCASPTTDARGGRAGPRAHTVANAAAGISTGERSSRAMSLALSATVGSTLAAKNFAAYCLPA